MKKILIKIFFPIVAIAFIVAGCEDDGISPSLVPNNIEDYDLIQLSTDNPNVIVDVSARGNDLNKISVEIFPDGSNTAVASNVVRNIIHNSINRIKVAVPFPLPVVAPSGLYTIKYKIDYDKGSSTETEYKVNILNYKTEEPTSCAFPQLPLPAGKNVWVQVTGPPTTEDDDVYVVGNFMVANGADGDWNPGNPDFKMTRVPNTNCYYIALNLQSGDQLKFTRGDWGKVMKDENGRDYRKANDEPRDGHNGDGNILYGTAPYAVGSTLKFTVLNWADNVVAAPAVIPAEAIKSGHITVVANVNSTDDDASFYLVKQGATSLTGAIKLIRVPGTSQMAAAVPKENGATYFVAKDDIAKVGINSFDVVKTVVLDGEANPVEVNTPGFRGELSVTPVPENLFIVGGATPGGWNNPVPVPSQQFTKQGNVFTLSIPLAANDGYLLLPVNGSWDQKFGMGGSRTSGDIIPQGGDFQSPAEAGTYLITVDFNTGTYTLVKQ